MRGVDARTLVVGFGDYRRELERIAPPRTLFTGPLEHRHLVHLIPLADVCVVPSIFPEAFGMVAAEAAAAGCPPLVARHSGLEEVAEGIEAAYPPEYRHLASFETGDSLDLADKLHELLALPADTRRALGEAARRRRGREVVVGGRRSTPARARSNRLLTSMGEAQKLPYDELIRRSRDDFDAGTDFTVAVEEEFALLDPETLSLVNRFEEVKAAAAGSPVDEHLVGELIASEAEVRTGRCASWAEASERMGERRAQLSALVAPLGISLAATGTHPWSRWQDQRIIDTPHYRRNDELLRYVVWRNNTFGLHVHVGIRGADRAIAVHDGLRPFLPHLLALSASSPLVEGVISGLHSARTEIFTRMFPRCGVPDAYGDWAGLRVLRAAPLRDRLDRRAHADLVERQAAPRVPDGRDPHLRRASPTWPSRARSRGSAMRSPPGSLRAARRGRAAARPAAADDRGEHVAGDPLRAVRDAARPRDVRGAPGARRAGAGRGVGRAGRRRARRPALDPGGQRRRAPDRAGRGGLVAGGDLRGAGACRQRSSVADETSRRWRASQEELLEQLEAELKKLKVSDVLVQTVFTVSSLGYRSLGEEARDLEQAKLAIDALGAVVPLLKGAVADEVHRDLEQMVANMQLAYAKAAAG